MLSGGFNLYQYVTRADLTSISLETYIEFYGFFKHNSLMTYSIYVIK